MRFLKPLAGVLAGVLVLAAIVSLFTGSSKQKLTAHFERATGLYTGSSVRMLGIQVGKVTGIEPDGQSVKVKMQYDSSHKVPADADAFIIPPSLVSDRYVQLAPVYRGGAVMRDNGDIPLTRTHVPVELSTVLRSVDDISVALGPNGANKTGALSRLVTVSARNLRGNGQQLHDTLHDAGTLISTIADNKTDLVGTINNLDKFTHALRQSDPAVRTLTNDLSSVSDQLNQDRGNLAAALANLGVALGDITSLVRENRAFVKADVAGLTKVTQTLLSQKDALIEALDVAPLAIQNLNSVYDPGTQSLRTKGDFNMFDNPAVYLCQVLGQLTGQQGVCSSDRLAGPLITSLATPSAATLKVPGT